MALAIWDASLYKLLVRQIIFITRVSYSAMGDGTVSDGMTLYKVHLTIY